jgi:sulfatase modifying factor 1
MSRIIIFIALAAGLGSLGCDEEREVPGVVVTTAVPARTSSIATRSEPEPAPAEDEKLPDPDHRAETLAEQRDAMLARMIAMGVLTSRQEPSLRAIFSASKILGQGNPAAVDHPMTRRACMDRRAAAGVREEPKARCGAAFMAPVYDPERQQESEAAICVDRYEFPNLPCDYPVTWVTTRQAQSICKVLGKRLCDAHEWEGACAGQLRTPEQDYALRGPRKSQSGLHNLKREVVWAYGKDKDHKKCATQSYRSRSCAQSGWRGCGSNTYPAGAFPACRSRFGIYDLHGNAAEHMLLPLKRDELGAANGEGVAEMKGSWFIFDHFEAHKDDCRWRAPAWHDDEGMNHANYHLGFRCCKQLNASH